MTKPDIDISPEAIVRAAYDLRAHGVYRTDLDIADMLEALAADRDKWQRLDAEAATHIESVICMRTGFTAEPPYVGWKGLGLALSEALDERDRNRDNIDLRDNEIALAIARAERAEAELVVAQNNIAIQQHERDVIVAGSNELFAELRKAEAERDNAKRELKRAADHLREFANAHSMEATAETWAILHCAGEIGKS